MDYYICNCPSSFEDDIEGGFNVMRQAIVRLVVLVILLINQFLITVGWNPLPFGEEQIFEGVSSIATVAMAIFTWWKNNNVTKEAQEAQEYLNKLKGDK